jgi:WD40 repeat protein
MIRNIEKNTDSIGRINPTCVRTLHGHQAAIKCLDFTPHILISGDTLGFVKIWHVPSGNCLGTIDMNNMKPGPMQFVKTAGKLTANNFHENVMEGKKQDEEEKSDPISFVSFKENRLALGKFSGTMYFYAIEPYGINISLTLDLWLKLPGTTASSTSIQYENLKQWCEEPTTFTLQGIYELETGKVDKSNTEYVAKPGNRTWALCVTMDAWRLMCMALFNQKVVDQKEDAYCGIGMV